jgi:hypothetical protein
VSKKGNPRKDGSFLGRLIRRLDLQSTLMTVSNVFEIDVELSVTKGRLIYTLARVLTGFTVVTIAIFAFQEHYLRTASKL